MLYWGRRLPRSLGDGESISAAADSGQSVPTIKFFTCFGYILQRGKKNHCVKKCSRREAGKREFCFPFCSYRHAFVPFPLLLHFLLVVAPLLFSFSSFSLLRADSNGSETSYRNTLESSAPSHVTMSSIPSTFAKAFKGEKGSERTIDRSEEQKERKRSAKLGDGSSK